MICQYCGKEIEEGLTFCIYCGEPQTEEAVRPVPEQKKSTGVVAPLLIVLGFAAAVAVAVWLAFFRVPEPQGEKGTPVQTETAEQTIAATEAEEEAADLPRVIVDEAAYKTMAEKFAKAILLRELDVIEGETHPLLREPFAEKFGNTDFVFESCSVRAAEIRKLRRAEERAHEDALREEFGVETAIDDAYAVMVEFEADFHGKTYGGAMIVVVADMKDDRNTPQRYVIMSALAEMDEAFYEDNFAPGDHYFDTHAEE